jgi:phosphatidylglycerophosphatase C
MSGKPSAFDALLRPVSGQRGNAPATVVFDLDGTLVRGDCGDALIRELIGRHWLRRLGAALALPIGIPMMAFGRTRRRGVSLFLWLGTVGLAPDELARRLEGFLRGYRFTPMPFAVAALERELAAGHRVAVATGALRVLAENFLQRLGIADRVTLVASEMQPFAGGQVASVQCNGVVKLVELERRGFPPPYLRAYSDSWSDHPLFAASRSPMAVRCPPRDLARLQARFGDRLQVLADPGSDGSMAIASTDA